MSCYIVKYELQLDLIICKYSIITVTLVPPELCMRSYSQPWHCPIMVPKDVEWHIYMEMEQSKAEHLTHSIPLRKWGIIYEHTKQALMQQIACVMVTFNKQTCPFMNKIILSPRPVSQPGIIAWSDVTLKVQSRLCVGPYAKNSWELSSVTKKRRKRQRDSL